MLGKSLAGNLLKWIPGFGTAAGAIINGTVAATITTTLGYALVQLATKAVESNWSGDSEALNNIFSEEMLDKYIIEFEQKKKRGEKYI